MPDDGGKVCTKCGVWKGFGEFGIQRYKDHPPARKSQCKSCQSADALDRQRQRPAEVKRAAHERYRHSARGAASRAAWRAANADRLRAYDKARPSRPASERDRARHAAYVASMSDGYVRHLCAQGTALSPRCIPAELVEFKREQLQLHRLLRDFQKVLSDEGEGE